ncbi:MAG: hypothetical protein MW690_001632 [Methanophagales archaeon]|nr:hypothetical protein [Methanophagales archaeon]MCU4140156.1 hypothetical protein [Methanophagales archaeon]
MQERGAVVAGVAGALTSTFPLSMVASIGVALVSLKITLLNFSTLVPVPMTSNEMDESTPASFTPFSTPILVSTYSILPIVLLISFTRTIVFSPSCDRKFPCDCEVAFNMFGLKYKSY